MATQIKITELGSISNANITYTTLVPAVNMVGTPITQKATLQQIGNVILSSAGDANFPAANLANIAYSVANAAQPNITSVGTLTSLSVNGNITVGGGNVTTKSSTTYDAARATSVTVDNLVARVASDGSPQVSVSSLTATISWSGYEIISGSQSSFNNTGTSTNPGDWQDITASTLTAVGDTVVAIVQSDNHIYRVTYVQTTTAGTNATTIIEKLL